MVTSDSRPYNRKGCINLDVIDVSINRVLETADMKNTKKRLLLFKSDRGDHS
jgi:hypothetical protein